MKTTHDPETGERDAREAEASKLTQDRLRSYLGNRFQQPVRVEEIRQLTGKTRGADALKKFGYGRPFLVKCRAGDVERSLLFHRIRQNGFGREREDDRAAAVWLDFRTFNRLPRHVAAEDMIVRISNGDLRSIVNG